MEFPELHIVLPSGVPEYIGLKETEPPHVVQEETTVKASNTPSLERVYGSSLDRLAENYTSDCEESPHMREE